MFTKATDSESCAQLKRTKISIKDIFKCDSVDILVFLKNGDVIASTRVSVAITALEVYSHDKTRWKRKDSKNEVVSTHISPEPKDL